MSSPSASISDGESDRLVVVVGTGRDGHAALEELLGSLGDAALTFVVVQDPRTVRDVAPRERIAQLGVCCVDRACELRSGVVHVVPPEYDVRIARGGLTVARRARPRAEHPIDEVLADVASEFGERAVGVVLSGAECMSSRGIDALELAGGRAIVQSLAGRELTLKEIAGQVRMHAARTNGDPEQALHAEVQELRAMTADLRARNRELERFTSAAAHDLKSPLRSIIGLAEIALEELDADAKDAARASLERIETAAWRMSRLISALLLFAKAGRSSMAREEVCLRDVVDLATEDLGPEIDEADATVLVMSHLPIVTGDPVLLRQLFQNLISNGVKYSAPGREPIVRISARPIGDAVELIVADNGAGIDPEDAERIFLPFQRGDQHPDSGGCGIGLTTCRRVVERHDGAITVVSEPGEGSAFLVRLPASRLVRWDDAQRAATSPAPSDGRAC